MLEIVRKRGKNGQRPISAFCNLHLLNFAQGYLTKLNFEMCSIIWSVTPFGIFSKKSTFPTFMFFTPPYFNPTRNGKKQNTKNLFITNFTETPFQKGISYIFLLKISFAKLNTTDPEHVLLVHL